MSCKLSRRCAACFLTLLVHLLSSLWRQEAFSQEELELLYISTIEANCFEIYKSGAQPGDFEEGTDPFEKERSYITYMMTREVTGEIMYVRGLPGGIESGALANGHGKGIEAHRQPS